MNPGEQFVQLARGGDPKQGVHRLAADILVAVRNAHRHSRQSASGKSMRMAVERQFHLAFDKVDKLVLRRVDMRRNKSAGFADDLERKRRIADFLEILGLSQNVPNGVAVALPRGRNSSVQRWHHDLLRFFGSTSGGADTRLRFTGLSRKPNTQLAIPFAKRSRPELSGRNASDAAAEVK